MVIYGVVSGLLCAGNLLGAELDGNSDFVSKRNKAVRWFSYEKKQMMELKKLNVMPTLILCGLGNSQRSPKMEISGPPTSFSLPLLPPVQVAGDGQKCPTTFPVVGTGGDIVSVVNMEKLILAWVVSCSEGEWGHGRENAPLAYLKTS